MTYYAVIDTNVIVSSMLKHNSIPGIIVDLCFSGIIIPLLNKEIVDEYKEVLKRNKFDISDKEIDILISKLEQFGIFLNTEKTNEIFNDQSDAVFYEVVMTAKKENEAYLVTGNIKHYPIKPYVVTPHEMLDIICK